MDRELNIKSICLIPAECKEIQPNDKVLLSTLAHFAWHVQYRIRFLFFEKPPKSFHEIISSLKLGLGKVLNEFYHVAGRLHVREDGLIELEMNNEGVMFIEAYANFSLEEFPCKDGDFEIDSKVLHQLADTGGHTLKWPWRSDAPLFFIQVTQFVCGAICISMRFSHQIVDGTSAWNFLKAWAETCCGKTISFQPELVNNPINTTPNTNIDQVKIPFFLKQYKNSDLLSTTLEDPNKYKTKCFVFRREMISKLKAKSPGYTTFQLLSTHIWDKVTLARNLDKDEPTVLHFAINCRERLSSLSSNYGGHAALIIAVSTTAGQVEEQGAALVKNAVASFKEREINSFCELIQVFASSKEYTVHNHLSSNDLVVGSSFHFPVYEDFGFGKPVGMTIIPTPNDGRCYYFPAREQGGVAAYLSLKADVMKKLEDNPSFLNP